MKKLSKVLVLVLSTIMVLAMSASVFAVSVTENGKGTITIENAVKGETYTVYLLYAAKANADTGAIVYGENPANDLGTYFKLDGEGYVVAKEGTTDATVGEEAFKTWAKSVGDQKDSKTASENGTLTFTNLPYGYYFVESSQGALITVNSLNPNATMNDKNSSTPDVPADAKKIVLPSGQTASTTSAAIGEDVDFEIKFDARNYDEDTLITEYTVKDTPSNLSIKTGTVVVKVVENPGTDAENEIELTGLSGIAADGLNLTIPWADGEVSKYANKSQIVITYTATVTSAAEAGTASNSAEISWTGNDDPEIPTPPTVKTYNFTLQKVDANSTTTQLEGAKFKLYAGETEVKVVAINAAGAIIEDVDAEGVAIDHYRVATAEETDQATQIKAGKITVKGLKEGTNYQLEETVAPDGYNRLTEKTAAFSVDATSSAEGVDVTVENNAGSTLPTTGGIGTTIFYVLGSLLVVGCGIVLVSRKRMQNNK